MLFILNIEAFCLNEGTDFSDSLVFIIEIILELD